MTAYIGTSGWAYKEWKPGFYPREVPQSRFLEHYSTKLTACEINATFYRVQPQSVVARWASLVPESFRFSAKAHRRLTYTKELAPDAPMRSYIDEFAESLLPLGPRLGVVLMQFPAFRERDDLGLKKFLDALPPEMTCAVEFRHASWDAPECRSLIAERGHAFCVSDAEGVVPGSLPEGDFAYMRLRGESYSDEERSRLRRLLAQEAGKRDVYVFAKHKGAVAGSDSSGVGLAVWLRDAAQ